MHIPRSRPGAGPPSLIAVVALALLLAGCDWSSPGYDPGRTAANPTETELSSGNVGSAQIQWSAYAGRPDPALAAPVVTSGMVITSGDTGVVAFDAEHGTVRWTSSSPARASSPVLVSLGKVVIEGDGRVWALDASTGAVAWSSALAGADGHLIASGDTIYALAEEGSSGRSLHAFDLSGGDEVFRVAVGGDHGPSVANGVVYVGGDATLWAYDAQTGTPRWHAPAPSRNGTDPVIAGDTVVTFGLGGTSTPTLTALDAGSGVQRWQVQESTAPPAGVAVSDGRLYLGGSDRLQAVDLRSGTQEWSVPAGGARQPAVANGVVYTGSSDDHIGLYDAASGDALPVWHHLNSDLTGAPAVANGMVYVTSSEGVVFALGLGTPRLQTSYGLGWFGSVGRSEPGNVFVTNPGPTPTTPLDVRVTGPGSDQFRILDDGCTGRALGSGGECMVSVEFAPSRPGEHTATANVTSVEGSTTARLRGTASPFSMTPREADLGTGLVSVPGPTQTFTLTNETDSSAGPTHETMHNDVYADATPSTSFAITSDTCSVRPTPAHTSCSITVRLTPTINQVASGYLNVVTPDGLPVWSNVRGSGSPWLVPVGEATFTLRAPPGVTVTGTITLVNRGPAATGPVRTSLSSYPLDPNPFGIGADGCNGRVIPAGGTCSVVVAYTGDGRTTFGVLQYGAPGTGDAGFTFVGSPA